MLIQSRIRSRIYSTVTRIKISWYNLPFFMFLFHFWFFLEAYFAIDKLSRELEQADQYYANRSMTRSDKRY